jgi:PAS domain S-box-containing protein
MGPDTDSGIRLLYVSGASADEDACRRALETQPSVDLVDCDTLDEALECDLEPIDCVVSAHDEDVDGLDALDAVRDRQPGIPFVLLADGDDGLTASRAVAADVSAYVPRDVAEAPRLLVERVDAVAEAGSRRRDAAESRMPIADLGMRDELWLKERAMDAAPVGITISDPDQPDNPLIYLNDAFEELTGYPPEETVGRNCRFLQGEQSDPDAIAAMREAIDEEEEVSVELVNYRRDGETFWNKIDVAPVRDDGEVTHYVGFQTDVTKRKEAELEAKRERQKLDHLLTRLNGLVQDVTRDLVRATSRDGIEQAVCDRIAATESYEFAWLGEPDLARDSITATAWAGAWDPAPDALEYDLHDDGRDQHPVVRAYETGETQLVEEPEQLAAIRDSAAWIGADRLSGMAAIPLAYHDTLYGVLTVYTTRPDALNRRETVVLEALARAAATAINALERGEMLAADSILDVEFAIRDPDLFVADLSARTECAFEYNGSVYRDDGSMFMFFTTDASPSAVAAVVDDHPDVESVACINEHAEGNLFEFTVAETSIITTLAERGAKTRSLTATDGEARIAIELPNEGDVRAIADLLDDRYPGTELVAHRTRSRPPTTKQEFFADLEDRLTERQLTALQKAYVSGYYEWNRPITGDDLGESMGIARSTFHQHLRAAERKLVAAFFER